MAGIWGIVNFDETMIKNDEINRISEVYQRYCIDAHDEVIREKYAFGCEMQYFTKESRFEVLPIVDDQEKKYFVFDGMLDNREELLKRINCKSEQVIPDGKIAYEIFKKEGEQCLNDLLGSFAFALYDDVKKELYIVTDATGTRCVYYSVKNGNVKFSTAIDAIRYPEKDYEVNRGWLYDFMAIEGVINFIRLEETMYQGIFKVPSACVMKIKEGRVEKKRYWNPKVKLDLKKTEEQYKKEFLENFHDAVEGTLRSEKEAVLLSGGYDSSAVVSVAAPLLRERGEKIYSYTSVPGSEYNMKKGKYDLPDESEKVKKTAQILGNVECDFIDLKGVNIWDRNIEYMRKTGIIYKAPQNILWIVEAQKRAKEKGCRILLDGGYGNVTISYGDVVTYFHTLLDSKKYLKFWKEINMFMDGKVYGKKNRLREIKKIVDKYNRKNVVLKNKICNKYMTQSSLEEYDTANKLKMFMEKRLICVKGKTEENVHKGIADFAQFSQKGELRTCQSLLSGVLMRDPTMDKRVVEFCMNVPVDIFCKNGKSRRLVSDYMRGIVPDHVIDTIDFGKQSADLIYKVMDYKDAIFRDMMNIINKDESKKVIKVEEILEDIKKIKEMPEENAEMFIRIFYTCIGLGVLTKGNN